MILIVTHKKDYTADIVVNKLNSQNVSYYRLNTETIFEIENFHIANDPFANGLEINVAEAQKISSVWFRRIKLPSLKFLDSPSETNYILTEVEMFYKNLWAILDCFWISNPFYVYRAENKLLQLKAAKKAGFITPHTLVTNSKSRLRKFIRDCDKKVIIKPLFLSQVSYSDRNEIIFTNRLEENQISELKEFSVFPATYQAQIPKKLEIRVTVVGTSVYSASIDSQSSPNSSIDWRRGDKQFKYYKLPEEIEEKCVCLVAKLGLQFGAIDLILTPNDEFVFLEINPNGQWGWIEFQTGQDISGAIINLLKNGRQEKLSV